MTEELYIVQRIGKIKRRSFLLLTEREGRTGE